MDDLKVTSGEGIQYIVIRIGAEQYGIDITFVDNIVRMVNITRCPQVAPYVLGVMNLRGTVIPVMSLRVKMGLEADEITKASRIIILKLEQHGTIGILVDEVREVITLESEQIEKVSTENAPDKVSFVQCVGKVGPDLVSILDLNAVASEHE